ncbi:MAG: AMP-binding protein, partial [Clostridia bacterium]|nr:AMP-binding protein [Clostridia bacterium]
MDNRIKEVAERIRELREILELSREDMAACTDTTLEQYVELEEGRADFSFTFIYKCANRFGVDVTDLLKGSSPTLTSMSVVRAGEGLPIARRRGFSYHNLSPMLRGKLAEPFLVRAPFVAEEQNKPIKLSTHLGQEIDIVLTGSLKVQIGDHVAVLNPGDTIHYDSSTPHGMIATGGEDCTFYAVVLGADGKAYSEPEEDTYHATVPRGGRRVGDSPVAAPYVTTTVDKDGVVNSIKFNNVEHYNFAYDCVDALAERCPDKLAMLHLDKNKNERRFSFSALRRESNRTANYLSSLGIKRGDRVLLVLKRHYQFWLTMLALHKMGAIAIPATNQLQKKDYVYRFNAAGVSAVICTTDDGVPDHVEAALPESPTVVTRVLVGGA